MAIPIFKIFMVFGIVSSWAAQALADGKISITEAADLGLKLGAALGVPTSIDVPAPNTTEGAPETIETVAEEQSQTDASPKFQAMAQQDKTTEGGQ